MSILRIVMLGPPGAGKGTQSVLFSQSHKIPHISTGDMMRAAVKSGNSLGNKVKGYLDAGQLVPDDVVIAVIEERLSQADCSVGFILDGFPRTVAQAQALDTMLEKRATPLTHIIELKVAESILLERIQNRGASGSGRSDDSGAIAANRLKVYWEQTAPVTNYYTKAEAPLVVVDGLGTVEEVKTRIDTALLP
jgi:adenylate kinase